MFVQLFEGVVFPCQLYKLVKEIYRSLNIHAYEGHGYPRALLEVVGDNRCILEVVQDRRIIAEISDDQDKPGE